MKERIAALAVGLVLSVSGVLHAQTPDYSQVKTDFGTFASDISSNLPFASTTGLNWSSAYIGGFPHFGLGVSAGFASVPTGGILSLANDFGASSFSGALSQYANLGLPLPMAVVELRLGGFALPFDVGVKVGYLPSDINASAYLPAGMNLNYLMWGADLRLQVVKEGLIIPEISIGAGYNHYEGGIQVPIGSSVQVNNVGGTGGNLNISAPTLNFTWASDSIDADVQVSKTILFILTPYVGAGLSFGWSTAGGGVSSTQTITGNPGQYSQYFTNVSNTSFTITSNNTSINGRVFGGASLNLFVLKIDLTAMYDVSTKLVGATVGTRLQF